MTRFSSFIKALRVDQGTLCPWEDARWGARAHVQTARQPQLGKETGAEQGVVQVRSRGVGDGGDAGTSVCAPPLPPYASLRYEEAPAGTEVAPSLSFQGLRVSRAQTASRPDSAQGQKTGNSSAVSAASLETAMRGTRSYPEPLPAKS